MSDVQSTLAERGARYGDFTDHAAIAQALQDTMRLTRPNGWDRLNDVQRQALTVIADKIARILSGDPNYADNWHDIQGYARLVEDRLELIDKVVSGEVKLVVNPGELVAKRNIQADEPVYASDVLVVPPWPDDQRIKYMAQGADGHWFGFACLPRVGQIGWVRDATFYTVLTIGDPVPNPNWRNTLQERPKSSAPAVDPRWFDGYPEMPTWRSAPRWATHRLQAFVGAGQLWFWAVQPAHTPTVFNGYENSRMFTDANIVAGTLEARPKC